MTFFDFFNFLISGCIIKLVLWFFPEFFFGSGSSCDMWFGFLNFCTKHAWCIRINDFF